MLDLVADRVTGGQNQNRNLGLRLPNSVQDLAAREAIEAIASAATPIPVAQAKAREQLWTPEKAAAQDPGAPAPAGPPARLWTPSDPGSTS